MRPWAAVIGTGIVLVCVASRPSPVSARGVALDAPSLAVPPLGQRERHPEINRAIRALEVAKAHLQKAAHDFGGHRAEALEAVDKALEQLKLALQYDKK
jgi:hypothetical protein